MRIREERQALGAFFIVISGHLYSKLERPDNSENFVGNLVVKEPRFAYLAIGRKNSEFLTLQLNERAVTELIEKFRNKTSRLSLNVMGAILLGGFRDYGHHIDS